MLYFFIFFSLIWSTIPNKNMITLELKDNKNLLLSKNDNFFSKSEKFTNWKFSRTENVKKYSKSDFEMFLSIVNATFNKKLTTNQF